MKRFPIATVVVILAPAIPLAAMAQLTDPIPEAIPDSGIRVLLNEVASGLVAPNLVTHAGDGSGRRFVVDQIGMVRILDADGNLLATPFLDVSAQIATLPGLNENPPTPGDGLNPGFDERGLLGLAFHPNFANTGSTGAGKLYTYHSEATAGPADFTVPNPNPFNHQSVITEWSVDPSNPNQVDASSGRVLMRIDEPQFNHNAGMLAFGPDGNLYIAVGDGGGANDVNNGHTPGIGNGQDRTNVLGTILRIDVNGNNAANGQYGVPSDNPFVGDPNVPGEIYASGLRNPFRFSFDGNRLIAADVGQGNIEEVNIITSGGNYGWNLKEGSFRFDPSDGTVSDDVTGLPTDLIDPVLEYDHDEGISVIGGHVARGAGIPELEGLYVFGDFSQGFGSPAGRLFVGDLDTGSIGEILIGEDGLDLGLFIKGFGQDEAGKLYLLASSVGGPAGTAGRVFELRAIPEPASWLLIAVGALAIGAVRRYRRPAGNRTT